MAKHIEKIFVSMIIAIILCQYYGFYLFAGWRGVVTAIINMIIYGLIAKLFEKSAKHNEDLATTYRAQLHNAINDRNNMENELLNAKQILRVHGLGK